MRNDLFAYFSEDEFAGKQILDFGCGCGASSIILARLFPQADIVGVELDASSLAVARKMVEYYDLPRVRFYQSPGGADLPQEVGKYDFVMMSAVFEHLLPHERKTLMPKLWLAVRDGGYLFINQTPNQLFPFELHTTMLPLINYLPDRLAHRIAGKFSTRIRPEESWEQLLRQGIRGATEWEIMRLLPRSSAVPVLLEPRNHGLKDRIDLYYLNTNSSRLKMIKRIARVGIKAFRALFGITMVPDLSLAIHKRSEK
jgi:2-polyprenyl-3-methyl-5-hydroxy-6-metoxy-1,4-benzoquinol methylase